MNDGPSSRAATPYTGAWSGTLPPEGLDDDVLVGTTLCNSYIIERVLGEGGMGRVYEASHTRIKRKRFAIKTLHPEFLRQPDIVARFQREAEAAASIPSDHVVGVYDVDQIDDGRPFMVAELLDGRELGEMLDESPKLNVPYAVGIVRQICKALAAAHAHGVVHRDMKPENVFLTGDMTRPHVKVLDFGISRLDDSGQDLTKTGMIMGTPSYMPPEQARGERVDHRADVYATGAILYRALTGQVPFDRDEPSATVIAVLTAEPVRPRALEASIPEHLEAIIQRAMAKEASERFASMQELEAALAPYDTAAPARTDPRDTMEAVAVRDARPLFVVLSAAALLLIVSGLGTAIAGVVRSVRGSGPSAVELIIGAVALLLALSTPLFLVARNLRLSAWDNTVRMMSLAESLRVPLTAYVGAYGVGWLMITLVDHLFVGRTGWPLWDSLLFVVACTAAALSLVLRRQGGAAARLIPAIALMSSGLVALIVVAIALRAPVTDEALPIAENEQTSVDDDGPSESRTTNAKGKPIAKGNSKASDAELDNAKRSGIGALRTLVKKHPSDVRVWRAIMIVQSTSEETLDNALDAAVKMHDLDDASLNDDVIISILKRAAASGDKKRRTRALSIIGGRLGSRGPDVLFDIGSEDARAMLDTQAVRKLASKALLIAYDMRKAQGCQAKANLLERAREHGDERTAKILRPLMHGTKSGCGFLRLGRCPAKCDGHAQEMRRAVQVIAQRGR